MVIISKLTMKCSITPVVKQDVTGEPVYSSPITDVKCFLFGSTKRLRNAQGQEYNPDFQILFLPGTLLEINYKISEIFDKNGNIVTNDTLYVTTVEDNYHPKKGLVLRRAYVVKR